MALPQMDFTMNVVNNISPEEFAKRTPKYPLFEIGGMYVGYGLDHPQVLKSKQWLDEFRFWNAKHQQGWVPVMSYRPDLLSYAERPSVLFPVLYAATDKLMAKITAFVQAGWPINVHKDLQPWLNEVVQGSPEGTWPVSYCKDATGNPGCTLQTVCADIQHVDPSHAIRLGEFFGVRALHVPTKRFMWSDPDREFHPDLSQGDHSGGPLTNPYPGENAISPDPEFDENMNRLFEAFVAQGFLIIKQENPAGPGGREDWLWDSNKNSGAIYDLGSIDRASNWE